LPLDLASPVILGCESHGANKSYFLSSSDLERITENTKSLIDANKEIGLEINVDKTKYMLLSRHQNVAQIRDVKIANRSFENVSQFNYLGTTVTNLNLIQDEIKRRLNSGNACYQSVQKLLSSRMLAKNLKIRIYKTIILPVVLYGCETWSLTLREEHRLRVFENRVLRRIFGLKRDEVMGNGENYITRSFMICTLRQV
jgi:hypothetical protein